MGTPSKLTFGRDNWGINVPLVPFNEAGDEWHTPEGFAAINRHIARRPGVAKYLGEVQYAHPVFRWLKAYGRSMKPGFISPADKPELAGKCYTTSMSMIDWADNESFRNLAYAEGLGLGMGTGGHLHAWNLLGGKVYDQTWLANPLRRYFGVAFSPEFIRFMRFTRNTLGPYTSAEAFSANAPYLENYGKTWKMP